VRPTWRGRPTTHAGPAKAAGQPPGRRRSRAAGTAPEPAGGTADDGTGSALRGAAALASAGCADGRGPGCRRSGSSQGRGQLDRSAAGARSGPLRRRHRGRRRHPAGRGHGTCPGRRHARAGTRCGDHRARDSRRPARRGRVRRDALAQRGERVRRLPRARDTAAVQRPGPRCPGRGVLYPPLAGRRRGRPGPGGDYPACLDVPRGRHRGCPGSRPVLRVRGLPGRRGPLPRRRPGRCVG
jgi:hypothetical protein